MAGWEWLTLPQYPTETWAPDVMQVPVEFSWLATVAPGDYRLITGLLDPVTGAKSEPVKLGELTVRQRPISLDARRRRRWSAPLRHPRRSHRLRSGAGGRVDVDAALACNRHCCRLTRSSST
ncbi:MAG: hypothetical protein R3A10_00570 [Caldilineaceae bacterium]